MLTIDPKKDGFSGAVDIAVTLDQPRGIVWLHGKGMHVTRATATPDGGAAITGTWAQRDDSGMAALTLAEPLPAGKATLHLEYDAPFGPKLEGLYKIVQAGTSLRVHPVRVDRRARRVPLLRRAGLQDPLRHHPGRPRRRAGDRQHPRDRPQGGGRARSASTSRRRSRSRATWSPSRSGRSTSWSRPTSRRTPSASPAPAPRRSPRRGAARRSPTRSPTPARSWPSWRSIFGIEYPYDKLDIIAVPDKGGAMENAGAVTFAEFLLLIDEKTAPLAQKRAYAGVDGARAGAPVDRRPRHRRVVGRHLAERGVRHLDREQDRRRRGTRRSTPTMDLLDGVQGAIGEDALVSARADPAAHRLDQRHRERVRLHHLPEGRRRPLHVRALGRRRDLPARRPRRTCRRTASAARPRTTSSAPSRPPPART